MADDYRNTNLSINLVVRHRHCLFVAGKSLQQPGKWSSDSDTKPAQAPDKGPRPRGRWTGSGDWGNHSGAPVQSSPAGPSPFHGSLRPWCSKRETAVRDNYKVPVCGNTSVTCSKLILRHCTSSDTSSDTSLHVIRYFRCVTHPWVTAGLT